MCLKAFICAHCLAVVEIFGIGKFVPVLQFVHKLKYDYLDRFEKAHRWRHLVISSHPRHVERMSYVNYKSY